MGLVKENVYVEIHVQEGDWIGIAVRVHQENISLDSTSPEESDKDVFFGMIDAALSQSSFDVYIGNNCCSAFVTWYTNRSGDSKAHIREAFEALQVD